MYQDKYLDWVSRLDNNLLIVYYKILTNIIIYYHDILASVDKTGAARA